MFIRNDTGECYVDYDPADMKKVDNASWICDISKFKKLLNEQAEDIVFYCGIATNNLEIMSLCDMSILLKASRETIYSRLLPREGTDDFANTEEGRQRHLIWKDEFEQEMINAHMIVVDANPSPEEIAKNIVNLCRH
jgi:broad-specificity NMP kinase